MYARSLAVLLAAGLAVGQAHAAGGTGDVFPYSKEEDAERLRATGEQMCREMLDAATVLGERLHDVGNSVSRLMLDAGDQLAREMAPAMRDFAERLDEMARELEQRPRKR